MGSVIPANLFIMQINSAFFMICPICNSPNIEKKEIREPLVFVRTKNTTQFEFDRMFENEKKKIVWLCYDCGCEF